MIWSKNAFIIKAGLSLTAFLVACGGDNSSKAESLDSVLREVSTIHDLGTCTADRYGDTVFVNEKAADYLCVNNDWVDLTTPLDNQSEEPESGLSSFIDEEIQSSSSFVEDTIRNDSNSTTPSQTIEKDYTIVPTKENLPACDSENAKQSVLVQADSILYTCSSNKWEPEDANGYVVKNATISGAAQKGPFKVKSSLSLSEILLRNDSLVYSGRKYSGEISGEKGNFKIPEVNLIYPYAVLEVRGQWFNEIRGEFSKDSMTLRVLTDLSKRTEVNVNLLTHLEYDRVVNLVNKGYDVYAAKKQADYEIMKAFDIVTDVESSEDLKTFVPSTNKLHNNNARLMAISLLFIADKNEMEIQKMINEFKKDLAENGSWKNEQMKADMADWAESFDGGSVQENLKKIKILDVPRYENYLTLFWGNAYGLGVCEQIRYGVVLSVTNKLSKNYDVYYICKENGWQKATDYEKDTYEWGDAEYGEARKGNVTGIYYVFEKDGWTVAKNENIIGVCTAERLGEIAKVDTTYLICNNLRWEVASVLRYDTYQFGKGIEGEVRAGNVNKDLYYVYENGYWRPSENELENNIGACVVSRENEKHYLNDIYYACKNKTWKEIADFEYYLEDCSKENNGVVKLFDDIYYICKQNGWLEATVLEYDTYGEPCGKNGGIVDGKIVPENKYVCDAGKFRIANENELSLGDGCVNYTENKEIRVQVSETQDSVYTCKNSLWMGSTEWRYGILLDTRDQKTYKTIVIGTQTWMAENLNYIPSNYSDMGCYIDTLDYCAKYGRLYKWSVAMDSVGKFSANGKGCGHGKICSLTYPVRGICPEGWHLPSVDEMKILITTVGGDDSILANKVLRSTNGWDGKNSSGNGTDAFGFSALPSGFGRGNGSLSLIGEYTAFWSSTQYEDNPTYYSYIMKLMGNEEFVRPIDYSNPVFGYSVRCIKD